jgi:hypothetical protein
MKKHLTEPNPKLAKLVRQTISGMAHWAGTGPQGKTCGECCYFARINFGRGTSTRCDKFQQLMNGMRGPRPIPATTAASKYFEKKAAPTPHIWRTS